MYGDNDYRDYLEHARAHKYIMKIGRGANARYFYTKEEIDAYRKKDGKITGENNKHAQRKIQTERINAIRNGGKGRATSADLKRTKSGLVPDGYSTYNKKNDAGTYRKVSARTVEKRQQLARKAETRNAEQKRIEQSQSRNNAVGKKTKKVAIKTKKKANKAKKRVARYLRRYAASIEK